MQNSKVNRKNLEWILEQPMEYQVELFQDYAEIMRIIAEAIMQTEMDDKCGERYSHLNSDDKKYDRWGSNPGSIRVGDEKVPIFVPRYYDREKESARNAESYSRIKQQSSPTSKMIKSILLGLSQLDYGKVSRTMTESFGLSQSTMSRKFQEESAQQLEKYESRDLSKYDFTALLLDGKHLAKEQVVICVGITNTGDKLLLGFIQTTSENSQAVKGLLQNLIKRNMRFDQGLLCILDGSKGLSKAVKEVFGNFCLIQRCQWHKRENVVSYLNQRDQQLFRAKLQSAYSEPSYEDAKRRLWEIKNELQKINRTAANSLAEGLEETLTLHRLGLAVELGKSLSTTNIIENVNSKLGGYLRKINYWRNSDMLARWVAMGLVEIEGRMRRINNYQKLYLLRAALKTELGLDEQKVA